MSKGSYTVRDLNELDASKVAEIHSKAFPNFFLSSLGLLFLKRFYSKIIKNENSICLGVFENNNFLGFVVGNKKNKGFYLNLIKKHFIPLGSAVFYPLLKSPNKILKILNSLKSNSTISAKVNEMPCILSICVDPEFGNKGIGSILLRNFETGLENEHFKSYFLTTYAMENDGVNKFYLKNGLKFQEAFKNGKNRTMNLYIKYLGY